MVKAYGRVGKEGLVEAAKAVSNSDKYFGRQACGDCSVAGFKAPNKPAYRGIEYFLWGDWLSGKLGDIGIHFSGPRHGYAATDIDRVVFVRQYL